jgi:two-component system sensor histidine kinase/response regulator
MTSILVIEDEELIRESIEDLLLAEGFEVITATNGEQGVDLAIEKQPHLIICDVMMPILNGYEVLEKIRQDKTLSGCDLNIIHLLSGNRKPILIEILPELLPTRRS